jgi:methanethiol S-methyltransferase
LQRLFVWAGGALFAGALAFCAYSYLFTWSNGAPPAPGETELFGSARARELTVAGNVLLFALFAVHHTVFARPRVKAWLASSMPGQIVRSVYVWTASLLLVLVCAAWTPIGGDVYRVTGARALAHAAIQLGGIALIAWAARAIDPFELAGIRQPAQQGPLQITGPYRWVRHPLYLGWIVAVVGAAHMTGDRLLFAAITSLYLIIGVLFEERSLAQEFPVEYRAYQQRVRWRVVPYVY